MCLILTVRLDKADAPNAATICGAAGIPPPRTGRLPILLGRPPRGEFMIPGPEGGCGCSFLTDQADWNAPTWDMLPSARAALAETLRTLRRHTTHGFSFEAIWTGDSPTEDCNVSIQALAGLAAQNEIGTKVRYLVE